MLNRDWLGGVVGFDPVALESLQRKRCEDGIFFSESQLLVRYLRFGVACYSGAGVGRREFGSGSSEELSVSSK